jgi:hypothetical protein
MASTLRRAGAVALGIAISLVLAVPAGANLPKRTDPIYGRFQLGSESQWLIDGVCPKKPVVGGDPNGPKYEESNQVFYLNRFEKTTSKDVERIGISVCWANDTAGGGDFVDQGTFRISDARGELKGTVGGSYSSGIGTFDFRLTVVRGTSAFRKVTGTLVLVGCPRRGSDTLAAARLVKFDPTNPYPTPPPACQP